MSLFLSPAPFDRGDGKRESFSSQVTSSSDDLIREYSVSAPVFKSPQKASVVHKQQQSAGSSLPGRNPVIDRLMGNDSAGIVPSNMRNESYYMATHDTWNASAMAAGHRHPPPPPPPNRPGQLECPTVHQPKGESLMIEQDASATDAASRSDSVATSTTAGGGAADATQGSLGSLSEGVQAFSRDQPGRQSMSEKRHATLDAKSTDTYQKRKKARDERLRLQQQEHKALRWKKSASVESLHLIGAAEASRGKAGKVGGGVGGRGSAQLEYLTPEEREALKTQYVRASSVRVSRSRGCNESFRQAVDRSYEEGRDFEIEDEEEDEEVADVVGGGAGGKSAKKKNKNSKILRNFGAMFRFGSGGRGGLGAGGSGIKHHPHRKSTPNTPTPRTPVGGAPPPPGSFPRPSTSSLPISQSVPDYQVYGGKGEMATSTSASDFSRPYQQQEDAYLQHESHQRRRQQQQMLAAQQQFQQHPQQQLQQQQQRYLPHHPHQQEVYDYLPSAIMRPGSRVGIADPGSNAATSDYEVIQRHLHRNRVPVQQQQQQPYHVPQQLQQQQHDHLRQQQQYQQQYHPQRVPYRQPRSHSNPSRTRPKSNFYEYDMWTASGGGAGLPSSAAAAAAAAARAPPVPQKPSDRAVQQHLSNIAATDPYLYGVTAPSSDAYGYGRQQQQQPSHPQQQQQQQQSRQHRSTASMEHQVHPHYSVRGQQTYH